MSTRTFVVIDYEIDDWPHGVRSNLVITCDNEVYDTTALISTLIYNSGLNIELEEVTE